MRWNNITEEAWILTHLDSPGSDFSFDFFPPAFGSSIMQSTLIINHTHWRTPPFSEECWALWVNYRPKTLSVNIRKSRGVGPRVNSRGCARRCSTEACANWVRSPGERAATKHAALKSLTVLVGAKSGTLSPPWNLLSVFMCAFPVRCQKKR